MINENTYLSRLTDTYLFIRDIVESVTQEYVSEKALHLGEGVREIIIDPKIWYGKVPEDGTIQMMVDQVVKKQTAKVGNYKKWILGYGLVLICAIFDDFLKKLIEEILITNPKFTSWNPLSELLTEFDKKTIEKKYKVFTSKLNFTSEELFDFGIFNYSVQRKLAGTEISTLNAIYEKRNRAAHSDGYVMNTLDELSDIRELFEKLIWNLSIKSRRKWQIKSELIDMIVSVKGKESQEKSS